MVLEESTSAGGVIDSKPMSVFDLMIQMEKQGHLNLKLSGHTCQRPPAVVRGEDQDRTNAFFGGVCMFLVKNSSTLLG